MEIYTKDSDYVKLKSRPADERLFLFTMLWLNTFQDGSPAKFVFNFSVLYRPEGIVKLC